MKLGSGVIFLLWIGCSGATSPQMQSPSVQSETMDGSVHSLTGSDAMVHSIIINDVNAARKLLKAGLDVRSPYDPKTGWHFLHLAAQYGRLEIAKILVEHGAPLNARNSGSRTALAVARANGHPEIVDYLVSLGAAE